MKQDSILQTSISYRIWTNLTRSRGLKITLEILEIVIEVLKVAVKHICNNVGKKNNLILSKNNESKNKRYDNSSDSIM